MTQGHEASGTIVKLGGAVVRTGKVGICESVGVWGVGGVGTHIVQLARLVGAVPVIAVDVKPEVLDRAVQLGADHAFDARDEQLKVGIADLAGGRMLDVAFDAAGLKSTFEQALDSVTIGGRLVGVGMSAESPTVGPSRVPERRHREAGTPGGQPDPDPGQAVRPRSKLQPGSLLRENHSPQRNFDDGTASSAAALPCH